MPAFTELPEWINETTVEDAYRRAIRAQQARRERLAAAGLRAAKARDSRLLKALEGGAEILRRMSERQLGAQGLDVAGRRVPATEYQLWRNAYTTADAGTPEENYAWIYGAAAILAGLDA
jgi:hypothetical protein